MQGFLGGVTGLAAWLGARPAAQRMGLAAVFGGATVLAMPPFGLWPLLFITYPGLVWLLDGIAPDAPPAPQAPDVSSRFAGWRATAATAWAFGFGFFISGLYWIGSAFLVEADAFAWMIPFVAMILPGGLALFFALAAVAARAVARRGPARVIAYVLAFALAEWLRGHVLTGFPWNAAGYALSVSDWLVQATAIWGLYGHTVITLLIALAPALLAGPGIAPGRRHVAAVLCLALGMPVLLYGFGAWRLSGPEPVDVADVRLRIVQPNIAQKDKWRPELRAANFSRLLRLSRAEDDAAGITHVIWPESALPFPLSENAEALAFIVELQRRFASRAHHEPVCSARPPGPDDRGCQGTGASEHAAAGTVGADEVGVAELADGLGPIDLAPAPQVAAREAAEHRRPARLRALALQRVEQLFDGVAHAPRGWRNVRGAPAM